MGTVPDVAVAFGVTLAACPIVLWALRRGKVLDVPTSRSLHDAATPRSGGLAPAIGCVVAGAVSTQLTGTSRDAILVISVSLGIIGLTDDLRPRDVLPRLLGQVVVAFVALIWLARGLGGGAPVRVAVLAGIVVWLVGYVNAFNFMDGINGLAVAQVVVAGVSWAIIGSHEHVRALTTAGLIAAAAAVAFAPFNLPRARMFLGDVGSYFLGGWLAVAAVIGLRAGIAPEAILAPLTVFLADAGVTLFGRLRRHEPWSQAHREHVYQQLVRAGWTHGHTTLAAGLAMIAVACLGALSLTATPVVRVTGDAIGLLVLAGYLKMPDHFRGTSASDPAAATNP